MPTKSEKKRRQAIVREIVREQREDELARMPLSKENLAALFDHLDTVLRVEGCDFSARLTCAFLQAQQLPQDPILEWLASYGGFCDCEILANVKDAWWWLFHSQRASASPNP